MKTMGNTMINEMKKWLLCFAVLLTVNANAQWVTNGPTGFNGTVTGIAVIGNNIFAGTDGGGVFLSTNNGASWTAVNNGLTNTNIIALVANGSYLFAGTNGNMFVSANNGASWTTANTGLTSTDMVFYSLAANGTDVFVGIEGDGVYMTSNNGASWSSANNGLGTTLPSSLYAVGSNVYAVSDNGSGVYISTNNGANWTTAAGTGLTGTALYAVAASGSNIYVGSTAATVDGLFMSTDNGATFSLANTGMPNNYNIYSILVSGSDVFVGTEKGGLYESTNNGASWTSIGSGLPTGNYISSLGINGSVLFAGTYGLNVWQQSLACSITAPLLTAATTSFCPGDSLQICVPGTYKSYSWNTGATGICVEAKQAGKYYVTVTDNNNCTAISDTITTSLYQVSPVTITSVVNVFCAGDSVQICAPEGFKSYSWNNGATGSCTQARQAGEYYVTITDNNGCTALSNTITTTTNPAPVADISATANAFCTGDSTSVCAPTGFVSYQWNVPGNSYCIVAEQQGDYYVAVTDTNGCKAQSNHVSITVYPVPVDSVTTTSPIFCNSDSASICALQGFTSYQWNVQGAPSNSCMEVNEAGNYYVTVTDNHGCTAESNHLAVSVYPVPSVSIVVQGDTLTSFGAVSYLWKMDGSPIEGATGQFYIAKQAGSYSVQVTDTNGCTNTSTPVLVTGMEELVEQNVVLFPNPSAGSWQLMVDNGLVGSELEVFDEQGQIIFKSEIRDIQCVITLNIAKGVYWLRISNQHVNVVRRLVRL